MMKHENKSSVAMQKELIISRQSFKRSDLVFTSPADPDEPGEPIESTVALQKELIISRQSFKRSDLEHQWRLGSESIST